MIIVNLTFCFTILTIWIQQNAFLADNAAASSQEQMILQEAKRANPDEDAGLAPRFTHLEAKPF